MISQIHLEKLEEPQELDWSRALCRQLSRTDIRVVGLFFSEHLDEIARAKAICGDCDLAEQCLTAATARREPFGVWGGELFLNGRIVFKKRGRGRPRKNASENDESLEKSA